MQGQCLGISTQFSITASFLCDPRSGLGYHKEYKSSNLDLMQKLVDYTRKGAGRMPGPRRGFVSRLRA